MGSHRSVFLFDRRALNRGAQPKPGWAPERRWRRPSRSGRQPRGAEYTRRWLVKSRRVSTSSTTRSSRIRGRGRASRTAYEQRRSGRLQELQIDREVFAAVSIRDLQYVQPHAVFFHFHQWDNSEWHKIPSRGIVDPPEPEYALPT